MEDSLPQDEMQDLMREFIAETEELLEGLDQHFVRLEESPGDPALINEIFRAVHSIKGSAGFLGFNRLVEVAHQSENILNKIRQNEMQAAPETIDIILESIDVLKTLLKEVKESSGELVDINPIKRKLVLLLEFSSNTEAPPPPLQGTKEDENPSPQPSPLGGEGKGEGGFPDETIISPKDAKADDNVMPAANQQEKDKTLRIDTDRLDQVMDLVGELVLSRNRLNKIISDMEGTIDGDERLKSLLETTSNLNLITTDLQLAVMKMRMVPIRKVFNKFPRMVRDISRKANKKINLEIYGEATEVDKSVIEELNDPLVHIIRNSIDHGIETSIERMRKGKSECGTITLGAFQEGNSIVVKIEDDGKGIDAEVIEKKARERGLIKSNDARLTHKEIISLIFEPGFSTAEKVTDISGRGVGMDVVKTNIGRINGIIDVNTDVGKGTKITLKIPLTLAIIQVLMVKISNEIYALPLSSILETVRVPKNSIKSIDGQDVLRVRDLLIPLVRLQNVLDINSGDSEKDWVCVVLMAIAEKKVGIIVDELCHQEEVVIKSVGTYFADIKEISGATITGDGKVGLILDPGSMIYQRKD
ncbi:MAG TPA: chemotaxis protein CheA, partial [Nitrospiraceae bacterium]|nr:chemotaxis protein CheA [Nitrospiraceae bacterium]